jgi:hypothetical protein
MQMQRISRVPHLSSHGPIPRASMPLAATDPCKIGVMGSTPMRSTVQTWKVARYGSLGRFAKPCDVSFVGSNPMPSAW